MPGPTPSSRCSVTFLLIRTAAQHPMLPHCVCSNASGCWLSRKGVRFATPRSKMPCAVPFVTYCFGKRKKKNRTSFHNKKRRQGGGLPSEGARPEGGCYRVFPMLLLTPVLSLQRKKKRKHYDGERVKNGLAVSSLWRLLRWLSRFPCP